MVTFILENISEKEPENKFGETPFDLAEENNHFNICDLISFSIENQNLTTTEIHTVPMEGANFENYQSRTCHYSYLEKLLIQQKQLFSGIRDLIKPCHLNICTAVPRYVTTNNSGRVSQKE